MRSVESTQYQAGLAVSGAWKGSAPRKSIMNLAGNPWIIEEDLEDFVFFTRFITTLLHHI